MTCDDAFDRMTGEAELAAEVRQHLDHCPRCRDMHAALGPALDALRPDPAGAIGSAPWLETSASAESVAVARSAAESLATSAAADRRRHKVTAILRYAALLLVAGGLGWFAVRAAERQTGNLSQIPSAACTRTLAQSSTDAASLVRTCAACHLR